MKEVAFDLPKHYPTVEPEDFVSGDIRSQVASDLCVDSGFGRQGQQFGLGDCMRGKAGSAGEQRFALTWRKVSCKTVLSDNKTDSIIRISDP